MSNVWSALQGGVIGVAVGEAGSAVVEPALEPARQKAEQESQARILDLSALAQLVAQSLQHYGDVLDDAHRNGYHDDQLTAAIQLALRAPGVGEAINAYRRSPGFATAVQDNQLGAGITTDELHHAYAKAQIEYKYWPALDALARSPLDPADIANAIVRGIMRAPFTLPYTPPAGDGKVKSFPVSSLDATTEAAATGTSVERLFVKTANAGRPMAPEEAAKATFRGILDQGAGGAAGNDYLRAILEGDIRGEWADAIYEYTREILTAHDHVELRLRGWYTSDADMYAGTALHGMSVEDTDRLFKVLGRPISYRNVFLGERRGGVYDGPTDTIPGPILKSLQESNIRPEWYNLANALVETKPTLFFVRTWLKDGHDPAQARTWLSYLGYSQSDIDAIVTAYSTTAGAPADPHVKSAVTSAYTALKKEYVNGTLNDTQVTTYQTQLADAQKAANPLLAVYAVLRAIENPGALPPGAPTGI